MSETATLRVLVVEESTPAESSNESTFAGAATPAVAAAAAVAGWDPYEVWRSRVFAPTTPSVRRRS